jgi:pSer/pThr/pTyr-binding forkhead associated (FHA) protein
MTTQTPLPPASQTVAVPPHGPSTESLEPAAAELTLDALPLLDRRARERTIAPRLALRGHYLALHNGGETRLLRLDRSVTHVGRGADADIRFDEYRVSRDHAILVRHGRYCRLLDNRSANGTFLNGRRIVATNVYSGDQISVGPVALQYLEVE